MASASSSAGGSENDERRNVRQKQVMVGELPSDFLRITPPSADQQVAVDEQAALALQQHLNEGYLPPHVSGRLSISVIEAKLVKNYGMTRMDPYVRIRIGHTVYETHTDYNGAKNPRWNKVFYSLLTPAETHISIEVYDECAFQLDEKVAWADFVIPEAVFQGETRDEWIPLSGQQGEGKEGFINLVLKYNPVPALVYPTQPMVAVMPAPYYGIVPTVPYYTPAYPSQYVMPNSGVNSGVANAAGSVNVSSQPQPVSQPQPQPVQISDSDVEQVKEMFPNMESDVIKTVLESHRGNKDQAINALLTLSEGS